ncbi:MAG TPA: Uma2 family endonuclease [Polyangiaceae bacterium]|nr:Uma2 family endonuclease [Polyangiaceae bacterium]
MLPWPSIVMQDGVFEPPEASVLVQHRIAGFSESWTIEDVPVPEGAWHDRALDLLMALLDHWIARTGRDAAAFRNLAVRVRQDRPKVGFDPDVMLVEPAPPGAHELSSLRLWEPGHAAPALVVEVVSPGHPYKDYSDTPDRSAAVGVRELVLFDPMLAGPKAFGGPHLLQGWRRTDAGRFERVTAGEQAFASEVLGGYFVPVDARLLRISSDEAGARLWPTAEEAERAEKERALARVAELEAELARRG